MTMNKLTGGFAAILIAGVAYAALAQTPEVKDITPGVEAAQAETPVAEAAPAATETVVTVTTTEVEAPAALATEVHSIVNADGLIAIRWTETSAELWTLPKQHIQAMCWDDKSFELGGIPGLAPIAMNVAGGNLTVGSKSISVDCPLPAGYESLGKIWADREAEHGMTGEFTTAHLRAMISVIEQNKPVLITPQRLKGHGGDRPMIEASLEQHWGQFMAHVLEVDGIYYMVPEMTDLAICGGTCAFPRVVVLHTHLTKPAVKKKSPPRVSTPEPDAPVYDPYRVRCGGCD